MRIKRDVLAIMATVPAGRVVTHADIGRHLDVMPRHVAYILATLDPLEQAAIPWHRAVSHDGGLGTPKRDAHGRTQADLLRADGVEPGPGGRLEDVAALSVAVATLPHDVPQRTRPPDMVGKVRPAR